MRREEVRNRIKETGIVPAVRVDTAEHALFAAEAVYQGGIPIVEISLTVPGATEVISTLVRQNPERLVGAGSVLNAQPAQTCLDAGAQFLTSDGLLRDWSNLPPRTGSSYSRAPSHRPRSLQPGNPEAISLRSCPVRTSAAKATFDLFTKCSRTFL
jgi:KDPG/KHG aldolase